MIRPSEIQRKAILSGVRDQQIEKDYVLSWILWGIAQQEQIAKAISFKGGTVLKKVYFKDYRFSEDLDFTILNESISNEQIYKWFQESFEYVREESNIPLDITDTNKHADGGVNFYVSYIGPLGGQGSNKQVKVDISRSEKLVFEPDVRVTINEYSDLKEHQLLCYRLEEVLIEKMRSVMQRMQARDLYDIWFLLEQNGIDMGLYLNEFKTKCYCKGLNATDFPGKFKERMTQYKGRWRSSLANQIKDLPEFEKVEREVLRHLKKLNL